MQETSNNNPDVIDLRVMAKRVWARKRLFFKMWPIVFVVSCIYILGFPRYYTTDAKLAPEMGSSSAGGTLSSLASSFGFNLGDMESGDAIYPMLYPDLMDDNGFVASLFNIQVVSEDGEINTTYYDYLKKHQKKSIWSYPMSWIKKQFKTKKGKGGGGAFDPYHLSEDDTNIAEAIRGSIQFSVDEKTGVITIKTKAQDALICKTLADSTKERLQNFITEYRTNKARVDYEYYKKLTAESKRDYEEALNLYANMSDANTRVSLKSKELKIEDVENDMQLKFNTYTTMNNQLEAAKAKVQERTPAFTMLKGAAVPFKPAGPKRMIFVVAMLFLATLAATVYILRDDLLKIIVIRGK